VDRALGPGDMSKLGSFPLVLLAAACVLVPACLGCTEIGGQDGVTIDVTVTSGQLAPGEYAIVAQVDGQEISVTSTIAADGSSSSGIGEAIVGGKHAFVTGYLFATSGGITIGYREGGGPSTVTLEVRRGAHTLARGSYTPTYMHHYPNGEACGPDVLEAHETLPLAAP
jgi:hypothetical protein